MSDQGTLKGGPREAAQLGLRLLTADGVPPDPARGIALIARAAQAGDPEACFLAATLTSSSLWGALDWDRSFDYLLRAAQQDHKPSQDSLRVLSGGPSGRTVDGADWTAMRGAIDLAAWLEPGVLRQVRQAPRIQTIEKFLPPAACDWLVARARARLERATIYDKVTGGATEDKRRTNSQCDLGLDASGVLTFLLRARIGAITGRPEMAMEIPKVLHYQPGETFAAHGDYLDPTIPAFRQELAQRGQRCETFLIYLNDGFSGGETFFPRIDLSYKGAKGDALIFTNVDANGAPDVDTEHAGLPPTTGEKWLFSQWIRNVPS
jgi:prolyl 4-hydroxylase